MAFTKTWLGTTGVYTLDSNWVPINVRTPAYRWILSGSGTTEYYMELAAGGSPGFAATPANVQINGTNATSGSVGSLAAGRWGYGNNDTLGFNTVYLRLADGTDPDTKVNGYVTFTQVPQTAENVRVPAGAGSIDGIDQSSVAINEFVVEKGHAQPIGSSTARFTIDPDAFRFDGSGLAYIDLYTANISPQIFGTGPAGTGQRGLYLTGSNLATLNVMSGFVGVAVRSGETSTVATCRVVREAVPTSAWQGVTLTTMYQTDGKTEQRCASTTTTVYGGKLYTKETGAITTMNVRGGQVWPESTGTITTANCEGGIADFTTSGAARTVTTLKQNPGSTLSYDPVVLTITNRSAPDYPTTFNGTAA